jgi:hypothetical protein
MLRRLARLALALPLLFAATACDDSFHVERAPEFPRGGGSSVSVFGVYRDGRLAPEAWDVFRSHLAPIFGTSSCEPGYPDILTASGTPTLQAVDDFSRSNGVTDELLDKLAPMAKGDLVLLITMTGRPGAKPASEGPGGGPGGPGAPPAAPMRSGRGQRGAAPVKTTVEAAQFEAVGIVFSVKAHKSVAAIRMSYSGGSLEDAIDRFTARLGSELPRSTCGGWKGDLRIDATDIKRLETQQ